MDTSIRTQSGQWLAYAYDLAVVCDYRMTEAELRRDLRQIRSLGISRVYAVLINAGSPQFCDPWTGTGPDGQDDVLGTANVNEAFARIALEEGLEPFATYKPYENGGGMTIPEGAPIAEQPPLMDPDVGGFRVYFDRFATKHPELRVRRRDDVTDADMTATVDRISFTFMLDGFVNHSVWGDDAYDAVSLQPAAEDFQLWLSRDNMSYAPWEGSIAFRSFTTEDAVKDANGQVMFNGEKKRLLTVELSGLSITAEYPYAAITLRDARGYRTIPYSMLRWYAGDRELICTPTTAIRRIKNKENWLQQDKPFFSSIIKRVSREGGAVRAWNGRDEETFADFSTHGFEFNWRGVGDFREGWTFGAVYGVARGRSRYMAGTLCEGYPEVQEDWLSQIRTALDQGYRGIDLRLQNHSSWVIDPVNYGFNEPVLRRYRELFGEEEITWLQLMQARGSLFVDFAEKAAQLVHDRGAVFQVNLNGAMAHPTMKTDWNNLLWVAMPKILPDWKRLIELGDEVTMKDAHFRFFDPELGKTIRAWAHEKGKPVWIQCYSHQAKGNIHLPFFQAAGEDPTVDGLMIYEFTRETLPMLQEVLPQIGYGPKEP